MSNQLTVLLEEVLRRWQGPLPRLSYVTDAGDNETAYYHKVLRRLRHPLTGASESTRLFSIASRCCWPFRCKDNEYNAE